MPRKSPPGSHQTSASVEDLIKAIERLPEGETIDNERVWYRSQKEHWLGWLESYDEPGYYGRTGTGYDAKYAYNHIVNHQMLLWLIEASGIDKLIVDEAQRASVAGKTMMQKAGAIRRVVPWDVLAAALWPAGRR
jgi:hypothetical protein